MPFPTFLCLQDTYHPKCVVSSQSGDPAFLCLPMDSLRLQDVWFPATWPTPTSSLSLLIPGYLPAVTKEIIWLPTPDSRWGGEIPHFLMERTKNNQVNIKIQRGENVMASFAIYHGFPSFTIRTQSWFKCTWDFTLKSKDWGWEKINVGLTRHDHYF